MCTGRKISCRHEEREREKQSALASSDFVAYTSGRTLPRKDG